MSVIRVLKTKIVMGTFGQVVNINLKFNCHEKDNLPHIVCGLR